MRPFASLLLIALTALSGCERAAPVAPSTAPTNITIAQYGHVLLYLPLYVANARGYFAEQGLSVTLVSTGGDEKTFAAVASGSAQYGIADPVFTAVAREHGGGGKVIASLVNGVPFWGITYQKDAAAIVGPEQLRGKRIAVYTAPSTNYAVMADTLRQNQVQKATLVQGAFGTLVALLKADRADIAMELEPTVSIAVADGASVVYSLPSRITEFAFTGVMTSDEYLAKNPKQAQGVVNALAKAVESIRNDPASALAVAKAEFPEVTEAVLRSALARLVADNVIPRSVVLSEAAWKNAIDVRRSLGDISGPGSYADNVDMQFATLAIP